MATALIISDGATVDYTPGSAVAAGDVVVQETLIGVAPSPIAANELGALRITGIVRIPKPTGVGTDYDAGVLIYWDVADQEGNVDNANPLLGKLVAATTTAATTMDVLLTP